MPTPGCAHRAPVQAIGRTAAMSLAALAAFGLFVGTPVAVGQSACGDFGATLRAVPAHRASISVEPASLVHGAPMSG